MIDSVIYKGDVWVTLRQILGNSLHDGKWLELVQDCVHGWAVV